MSLSSFKFVIFIAICYIVLLGVTNALNKKPNAQKMAWKTILTFFSFCFMAYIDIRFFCVLVIYSLAIYLIGIRVLRSTFPWTSVAVVISFLLLGFFKYTNFFIESISYLFGLKGAHIQLFIPLGLSFYTLSGISYIVDIHRKKFPANLNLIDVFLYLTFFGKITAGPIVRYRHFENEIRMWHGLKWSDFQEGIQRFVIGMFKKMVLADHLGVFVNDVFFAPSAYSSFTVFLAVISYSLQIYFDFSGYSDMALGASCLFGLHFEENFSYPYLSRDLTEFWKKWHISLSTWFQEYLYYPLGGNRKGAVRTYINLFIVMIISGLWHGASWTFVIWGALHGMGLIIQKLWTNTVKKQEKDCGTVVPVLLTYAYATFCWIFFRADSFGNACDIIRSMVIPQQGIYQPFSWLFVSLILLIISSAGRIIYTKKAQDTGVCYPVLDLKTIKGLTLFFVFCGLTIGLAYLGNTAFIYEAF